MNIRNRIFLFYSSIIYKKKLYVRDQFLAYTIYYLFMGFTNGSIVETLSFPGMRIRLSKQGIVHIAYLHASTIDVKEKMTITKEAKEYSIRVESEQPFLATAIVVENIAYQLMADFYFKFYKPKVLYKVFKSEDKAIDWLLDVKKNPPAEKPQKGKIAFWNF